MERIDAAILGLGQMGNTHIEAAIESPYINQVYGFDPAKEQQKKAEKKGVKITSFEEIMNNPEIKLVYIASVNAAHSEQAQKALKTGKAVLCEKPMGETLSEAENMIRAEKETGAFLQIGFELHYSKMYQMAKEWIDADFIGDVVNSHCRYYCSEFHLKNTWRSNSKGSLIGEKLSHYLDLQRWFTGSKVEEVYAMSSPNTVEYFNHPDNHQINLRYENGAVSNLNFVMHIAETDHSDPLLDMLEKQADDGHFLQYYIFGTKGAIETDVFRRRLRRWKFTDSPKQLVSKIVDTVTYEKSDDNKWMHNVHGQNLRIAELVAERKAPENPASDSLETMKVCFAAEMSDKEHRIIKMSELD